MSHRQEVPTPKRSAPRRWRPVHGGARVFAARGKRLCCRPPPTQWRSYRYVEIWKVHFRFSLHFQKCSNFSIFFTVSISTIFFTSKGAHASGTPLDTPLAPPIRSAMDILMFTRMVMVWTVNSTLSWGVYNCLTQWNLGLGWSTVTAKKNWESAYR